MATSALSPPTPALPQQWADEIALATSTPSGTTPTTPESTPPSPSTTPQTLGGPVFDRQLDGFLDRFQAEIVAARALKDDLDRATISPFSLTTDSSAADSSSPSQAVSYQVHKDRFKRKMERIRALFATEGEDFVANLERRNPKLTMDACGQNTIELAKGIERLETAVKEEESKRIVHLSERDRGTMNGKGLLQRGGSGMEGLDSFRNPDIVTTPPGHDEGRLLHCTPDRTRADVILPPSVGPATVGHTLSNLTSDETLQLMQSDIQALKLSLMRLQRSRANTAPYPNSLPPLLPTKPSSDSSNTIASPFSVSTLSPSANDNAAVPASILANNNVSVVRVTGRANGFAPTYVSHLEQMKTRLEALEKKPLSRRAKSAARLGRTQTMGSMYETPPMTVDENCNPNVCAMITPPRASRRMQYRSISTQSPLKHERFSPVDAFRPSPLASQQVRVSPVSSSASPGRQIPPRESGNAAASGVPTGTAPGAPARLFFDAPEELLSKPQSHAAARDIQRYSLKVARRFGLSEKISQQGAVDGRAKSAVTVSPSRRRGLHADVVPTLSDVGTVPGAGGGSGGGGVMGGGPSTIDTTGSGGRVVEEIEGDMWVKKGVVWKRWRRRYASIVSHQFFGRVMCLFSYDSGGGVISTRSQIVVLHGSLCRAAKEDVEIGGVQRFMYVLRTSSKEYMFAVESDEVRRNWIRELKEAAREENGRLTQKVKGGRSMAFRKRGNI